MLGDSFTVVVGVKDAGTLPANLERELAALTGQSARDLRIEVLNFGRSATSTKVQVKQLEQFALMFDPDVVIIVLFLNDAK